MLSCCASPRKKPAGKGVSSNSLFNSSQLLTATQSPDATLPISTAASPSIAEDEACAPCDADTSSRMPFSSCADSPYTASDAEWLLRHHRRKVLDTRVKIVGVAARSADAQRSPAVLMCYPLRVTQRDDAESDAGTHEQRRETRGGSVKKWTATAPVPWPNMYWLVDPQLGRLAGQLEHEGLVQTWQQEVADEPDGEFARALAAAHRAYGAKRWALLSDDDREYCLAQPWATEALRDTGVGGFRFESQVKCLHAHLGHALAGGPNPVGERVLRLINAERVECVA